jgi:hypothetical protein
MLAEKSKIIDPPLREIVHNEYKIANAAAAT